MAISFQFWFSSLGHFLPVAVFSAYKITFSAFLIVSGREKGREKIYKNLVLLAGIVNIVSTAALFFIPVGSTAYGATEEEIVLRNLIIILSSLITFIPGIISFGVVFSIYGYKNRRHIGNYLMYSGLFWLIFTIWASISISNPYSNVSFLPYILDDIFNFPNFGVLLIMSQILAVGFWFNVLGNIFLLIHAFLNKDRRLKIAGLIYLTWYATIGLSSIPYYLSIYL